MTRQARPHPLSANLPRVRKCYSRFNQLDKGSMSGLFLAPFETGVMITLKWTNNATFVTVVGRICPSFVIKLIVSSNSLQWDHFHVRLPVGLQHSQVQCQLFCEGRLFPASGRPNWHQMEEEPNEFRVGDEFPTSFLSRMFWRKVSIEEPDKEQLASDKKPQAGFDGFRTLFLQFVTHSLALQLFSIHRQGLVSFVWFQGLVWFGLKFFPTFGS